MQASEALPLEDGAGRKRDDIDETLSPRCMAGMPAGE